MSQIKRSRRKVNFTTVDNTFINDERLSFKAKGLLIYLLSKPDDWQTYITQLSKASTDGKDSVMSGLNELIEYSYITREKTKDKKGKFSGYDYTVYDTPIAENPNTENPNTENPQILNTNSNKRLNKQKTESIDPLPDFIQKNRGKLKRAVDEEVDFTNETKPTEVFLKYVGTDLMEILNKYPSFTSLHKEDKKKHLIEFSQNAVTKYWSSKFNLADHIIKSLKYYKPTKEVYKKTA